MHHTTTSHDGSARAHGSTNETHAHTEGPPVPLHARRAAKGLGWFSIGLGLTQQLAPRGLARVVGLADDVGTCTTMRAMGVRELASGIGVLASDRPAPWLWMRVAGDLADLTLLGVAGMSDRKHWRKHSTQIGSAMAAVGAVAALDVFAAERTRRAMKGYVRPLPRKGTQNVTQYITINRPPEEVYRFWRDFSNLPQFMAHLESVEVKDDKHSHWTVKAPAGRTVQWDAELVEDKPSELIAWRSIGGTKVRNAGVVRFEAAPGGRGTQVRVELRYDPPAGKVGVAVAKLFGREPEQQTKGDLRRLKQVLETGYVVHSDSSIHRGMHPARPPKNDAKTQDNQKEMTQ